MVVSVLMSEKTGKVPLGRQRVRNLRRSRRYLAANEGGLARLLNTYSKQVKTNPKAAFLSES